jgi:hypothetical protein
MRGKPTATPVLTLGAIERARAEFLQREPRRLFYRVAIELMDLSRKGGTTIKTSEALAVLLQTWNASFYRFGRKFSENDFVKIHRLLKTHHRTIEDFRCRSIESLVQEEEGTLRTLFDQFANVLGSVGASKSLHLLAPPFFPLWDRSIAKVYGVNLDRNYAPIEYVRFMHLVKNQCKALADQGATWPDLLKAIDEYNYCKFTLNLPL